LSTLMATWVPQAAAVDSPIIARTQWGISVLQGVAYAAAHHAHGTLMPSSGSSTDQQPYMSLMMLLLPVLYWST
jgi:hypothetical protein